MAKREGVLIANGTIEPILTNGEFTVKLDGAFNSGTFQLEYRDKEGTWHNYPTATYAFTTATAIKMHEVEQTWVRGTLTGATAGVMLFYMIGV